MKPEPALPGPPRPSDPSEQEPMLYCPSCNARLAELKCKLICQRCGYYMSCADYY
ncbi:MAG: hypothetical protein IT163_09245 [Bryobacterales bacterium]|nr:hypothetical protein [Bryobacterales bacterium]